MPALPEYVVLKSKDNGKYMEYVKEQGNVYGRLRFTGEDVHNPRSKFQAEMSATDSKLVHLRCCYNNKYLALFEEQYYWVTAEADKPEEDRSKRCTLFEPHPVAGGGNEFRFKRVKSGTYARLLRASDPKYQCLIDGFARVPDTSLDVFTVIDWKSLVVLPQHVAFKGDNGNYLRGTDLPNLPFLFNTPNDFFLKYLHFTTSDSGDARAAHEVFPNGDGSIRLKSTHYGQFWRRSPNWIWADTKDTSTNNIDTLFWPVKVDDNTIALRNLGNNRFCQRLTTEGKTDCLNASASTISKEARLQVIELVLSRHIYNVEFYTERGRRYNEKAEVVGSGTVFNTTNRENSFDVKVARTETNTNSWNSSVSLKVGVKTTLVTKVPFVAEGKIELSAEFTSTYQWGKVETKTNTFETVYKTIVPPMTKTTVSAIARTATCDVPFSYTQTVTLMDGTKQTHKMSDGVYTGVNSFDVSYKIEHRKI